MPEQSVISDSDLRHLLDSSPSIPHCFSALAERLPTDFVYWQTELIDDGSNVPPADAPRRRVPHSFADVVRRVAAVAAELRRRGVGPGSRVGILANSRGEWLEADMAVLAVGGVSVSIYPSLPPNEIGFILGDAEVEFVFCENEEQVQKVLSLHGTDIPLPATEDAPARSCRCALKGIVSFEGCTKHPLVTTWADIVKASDGDTLPLPAVTRETMATLVYTSGTSGPMKGVMQSHGNHLSNVRQALESGVMLSDSHLMVFLPLAHSFARLMGMLGFLTSATVTFPAVVSRSSSRVDQLSITRDIRECGADIFPVVPRLLEKMERAIRDQAAAATLRGALLRFTIDCAERKEQSASARIGALLTAGLRGKLQRALFGPRFRFAIAGGAKLPGSTARFFQTLGITVLEGYGLTETCVATNINRPWNNRVGTVGPVLAADIEVRIDADGEILFRGPNIALGYLNRPTATKASWGEDGWLRTGDLGSIDAGGCLAVSGRKKEIIVLSTGKKVSPLGIEESFAAYAEVLQAVVLGEGRPYCVALIVPNVAVAGEGSECRQHLSRIVAAVNENLAAFAAVKKFEIINDPFTVENGLLTPTLKVKRGVVAARYAGLVDTLYGGRES